MKDWKPTRRQFTGVGLAGCLGVAAGLQGTRAYAAETKTLRVRLPGDIGSLDPARIFQVESQTVATNLFNGLVRYDDASGKVIPDLAERWDVSPDGRSYTFYLRDNVKWHKGYGQFTADDVKFSIERIQDPATASSYRVRVAGMKVEVLSPLQVRVSKEQPDPRMLHALTAYNQGWLVSRKAVTEIGVTAFGTKPIGTGPFVFERWSPGTEVVLSANPDYFQGRAKLAGLVFRVIRDETAASAALTNGEIDVFYGMQAPDVINTLRETPGITVTGRDASYTMNMVMNTSRAPFDNINARHALGHAVNRDALIKGFFKGTKTPAISVITNAFPEYTEDVPRYPYDPNKARELLKRAGAGPFNVDVVAPASAPYDKIVVPIANDLNAVGFTAKIVVLERGTYAQARAKGNIMTAITGVAGPANADNPLSALYAQRSFPPGLNTAHYTGAEDLFAKLDRETDEQPRLKIYHALQQRTMQDLPVLPLFTMSVFVATRPAVKGMVQNAMATLNCYPIDLSS